jgi:arsenite methyltransferase
MTQEIHELVRERYARAALSVVGGTGCCSDDLDLCSCCTPSSTPGAGLGSSQGERIGGQVYDAVQRDELPEAAVLASLGCGNPIAVAELRDGERVLDMGSGGGIDVLLSARRVGPTGQAIGLDMTDEMLALARANAAEAGVANATFVKGQIEAIPLPPDSIDFVISNCVVNLAADKPAVFREVARVLRPGGRIGIADIVAENTLTPAQRAQRGSYVGCIAGALSFEEYELGLRDAGLANISVVSTHAVAEGMHSAIIRATKPASSSGPGSP